ncbi:hypothetical protein L2D14_06520 [Thalassospiraceae bacterium LMO-JJ14]|nr:hypothetical protein L2D14_06520 [Thalassospiraceae bacterium LMO-JJ14]
MIHDVANLLRSFAEKEAITLEQAGIRHAPTIGEMYEGLTTDILERTIPPGLGLQVVSGFAEDDEGELSNQIDCMLVRGKGTPVPYTDKFKWHIKDVIAVIEVKKNLFSKSLDEAYHQLREVLETHSRWIQKVKGGNSVNMLPSRRAFSEITGIIAPSYERLSELPPEIEHIFHTVVGDQFSPVRIAFGYGGFSSEYGLRKGFLKFLEDKLLKTGYGPHAFPQLIVAGGASLVKFTGHPYRSPMNGDNMLLLASSSSNPLLLMLELIWTRLSYIQPMPELFGEDLQMEGFSPLLWTRLAEHPENPEQYGWICTSETISKKALENAPVATNWEPNELTKEQFVVINLLCQGETVDTSKKDFLSFVSGSGLTADEFINTLIETRLVARKGKELELTTVECLCVILPDGRSIAAENNTGRLSRWIDRYMQQRQESDE